LTKFLGSQLPEIGYLEQILTSPKLGKAKNYFFAALEFPPKSTNLTLQNNSHVDKK
jgi:hypothetical protein